MILESKAIYKKYKGINKELTVLDDINFTVPKGEIVSIDGKRKGRSQKPQSRIYISEFSIAAYLDRTGECDDSSRTSR